jgi:hypothetical protein
LRSAGHDQRRCVFLTPNPGVDRAAYPPGEARSKAPLFLCLAKGKPLITTMRKCRFCRDTNLWYQPAPNSPDYAEPERIEGKGCS